MDREFQFFFEKIAADRTILQKILHFAIDNPKLTAKIAGGSLLGLAGMAYLLPKIHAASDRERQQQTLNSIAGTNYAMARMMAPVATPTQARRDEFIYV